ncbi:uncharacterized protein LOC128683965 [Plodia interpunctella]|uniref:uncharacterized protein LOC128683965 n=1 Tax=Plodia interpunctella TaxID=58824 RepID=UPI002368E10E|nr:uncharacterized protein LOC128683965 [Plodia interpunctella]
MAVTSGMFLFEVVIEKVNTMVDSRALVIRSDFADIFSLELKDPKQMHIVIPEPPPLPPDPPGKKKKAKPKPKKGKKGKVEAPPPEPVIQSGQSVLFTSTAEFLIQTMKLFPMELSLWNKEDNLTFIGLSRIDWDPQFLKYLERICDGLEAQPVTLTEEYNVFEEGTAKLMAKIGLQIKLSYLTDKVTTAFRTLSEDPAVKKYLYTGINSKTTSYVCTMKTSEETFIENSNKIENNFVQDKPKSDKIVYADYKNAPGANLTFFNEGDYCCMGNADKPPESIYRAPEKCPDVDFIVDYVRKIIVSCNDNMRMLTPRPTISPRVKATDIDRLCYCQETKWPEGQLADRFKDTVQKAPCPVCINAGKKPEGSRAATFDIANIRGPCGRPDCRIARDMRAYIENLVEEDDKVFDLNTLMGPCGSKTCTLAQKIQEFIRHEGVFTHENTQEGLSTQCGCLEQMKKALTVRESCSSVCSKDCQEADTEGENRCEGKSCPFSSGNQIYNVFYFTVEHDFEKDNQNETDDPSNTESDKYKYCPKDCPSSMKDSENISCSKTACSSGTVKTPADPDDSVCAMVCPGKKTVPPSPADSDIVIHFDNIHNPCCVKSCDVAETVKDFIVDSVMSKKKKTEDEDPCYCDCTCTFKFSNKTTYCAVCGGYECLGEDMKDQPEFAKPHPCPIYHKLYDKKYIKTPNPFPDEEKAKPDNASIKTGGSKGGGQPLERKMTSSRSMKSLSDKKSERRKSNVEEKKPKKTSMEKKKVGKFTANVDESAPALVEKKPEPKYPYPQVPKNMGWNWTADDIPGLKFRPQWKPGAANKILVRRYRAIREGLDSIIAKKKRAMLQRKKKVDLKPTLVVKKLDGEYTVTMEVFKKYSKERLLFQHPYEDKPPLVYTIGKTEAEKEKIQKQRERRERRETRRKCRLLQSTFRDRCQEICVKAYNQAIGILPLPNPNDPECPCQLHTPHESPPIDSCSCSEEGSISSEDTDGDDWTIEFSPPAARYDAKAKHPPVMCDNESQYTYLDYRVKILDKHGNQIPRFFKGPDGKQVCSDLGGFWGPNKVWLEINKDGYLGPDGRWVPMNFTGPDGMLYSAEEGFFVDSKGQNLKIGIDGYIDQAGKWVWYPKRPKPAKSAASSSAASKVPGKKVGKGEPADAQKPKVTSRASSPPKPAGDAAKGGDKGKTGKTVTYGSKPKTVMNVAFASRYRTNTWQYGEAKTPLIEQKKLSKYQEIMRGLMMYDDIAMKIPTKQNRASNTGVLKPSSPYNTNMTTGIALTGIPSQDYRESLIQDGTEGSSNY